MISADVRVDFGSDLLNICINIFKLSHRKNEQANKRASQQRTSHDTLQCTSLTHFIYAPWMVFESLRPVHVVGARGHHQCGFVPRLGSDPVVYVGPAAVGGCPTNTSVSQTRACGRAVVVGNVGDTDVRR